jgi:nucleoside-diphosphate-sugar epimerase
VQILLTGGTGAVGRAAVARLVAKGHCVRVIGRRAGFEIPGTEYVACDINDYARVREVIRGCGAVVHLAALPRPSLGTPEEVFRVNALGTFNVFQAAAAEGIRRVVQASSINALGMYYGVVPATPSYFPIDEDHPTFTTDAYSFSKNVVEDIGAYFWRREGISSVALRLPGVWRGEAYDQVRERQADFREMVARLLELPKAERRARVAEYVRHNDEARGQRMMEDETISRRRWSASSAFDRETLTVTGHRNNFWTGIDERDSALAIECGLAADYEGSHPLFINDSHNVTGMPSETLARLFWPEVVERKRPLEGTEAVVSIDRARQLIGFEPEYSCETKE